MLFCHIYTATGQKLHVSSIFNQPDKTQDKTTKQVLIQHDFTHYLWRNGLPFNLTKAVNR